MQHLVTCIIYIIAVGTGWALGESVLGFEPSPNWFAAGWTAGLTYLLVLWRN